MKKYQIIYVDPPWSYRDKSKSHGGGAESHYDCMTTGELSKIKIPADDNAVLLMWCTYPQLEEGLKLIKAWGFTYKTVAFTWVKTNKDGSVFMGMGRYTRANAEICLLAIRGKGLKRINASVYNTQLHPRESHSKKPSAFRNDIVKLYGNVSRIELFARKPKNELFPSPSFEGWDVWGNEVDSDIELPDTLDIVGGE